MQEVMHEFQLLDGERNEQSRTKENVIHIAEFSSSGRGESELYRSPPGSTISSEVFIGHVTEPELATRLEVSTEALFLFISHFLPETTPRESIQATVRCDYTV